MAHYAVRLCGGVIGCPNDPAFEHDSYYGCVPKDFSPASGRSKTYRQFKNGVEGRYRWNGGCDATATPEEIFAIDNQDDIG